MQELLAGAANKLREMTWDEFAEEFRPLMDPDEDTFLMFGKGDFEHVRDQSNSHPGTVWTLMDDGEGGTFIGDGLHFVNSLNWIITEVPAQDGIDYVIDHDHGSNEDEWDDDHDNAEIKEDQ